jgi:cytoskeletal protein RodZ
MLIPHCQENPLRRTKLLLVAIALVLTIAVPLVVAQMAQSTQTIHVSGSAKYPRNIATPTPTSNPTVAPTSTATVNFSVWFPNGTSCPTTLTNLLCNIYGPLDSVGGIPATTQLVVRNDGNVPINIAVTSSNVNVPSNIQFTLGTSGTSSSIAVGQSANVYIAINMVTTNTNFVANTPFSYSFDVNLAATQA